MKRFFGICFVISLGAFSCGKNSESSVDSQSIAASLLGSATIYSSCTGYYQSEINCSSTDVTAASICVDTEMDRIRDGISPKDQRKDENAALFYECFFGCNTAYNTASGCTKGTYASLTAYRSAQRSLSNQASVSWKECFDSCRRANNKIPPTKSPLSNIQLSFPSDPFGTGGL